MTLKLLLKLAALAGFALSTSGCLLAAGAAAGAIAVDEIQEKDGKFDPLEEAYDGDPSTAGPLDREDDANTDDD
ncbi:MAG: hypothetical protein AAGC56_06620 [Pseudomonadota bacterium]